ncbi:hypothetical protein Pcinc_043751 [Petrolisthes cinctipes]|uniref:Uncharacterized protein n=1 Tax=Petrolisthes cinctipes TaxID=88211 RepID=A0AAE1BFE7_PETCI|nr:hypothetical protein Pcinc_043751 [Petrolisthes cinctipes]
MGEEKEGQRKEGERWEKEKDRGRKEGEREKENNDPGRMCRGQESTTRVQVCSVKVWNDGAEETIELSIAIQDWQARQHGEGRMCVDKCMRRGGQVRQV